MSYIPKIIVLGGGFAGLTLCTRLDALAGEGLAEVTMIERNPTLSVGGLFQYVMKGHISHRDVPIAYEDGKALRCSNVRFLSDEVTRVDPEARQVVTRSLSIDFDYLAIAVGANYTPELIPGLGESAYNVCNLQDVLQLRDALDRFEGGRIVMSIPRLPYKCPTVPQEYILVTETMIREAGHGIREKTEFAFTTEADGPFPMTGFFKKRFEEYGIKCVELAPLREVDTANKTLIFDKGRDGEVVDPLSYDLLMAAFPLSAPPAFQSLCDDNRLIVSDPRSMKTQWEGVWALGDCARMPLSSGPMHPKAGSFAMCQAEALAQNLEALVRSNGKSDAGAENLGIAQCDTEVGNNEGACVSVNLMGGPTSKFELSPVSEQAIEDKLEWICSSIHAWFKERPNF